MPDDLSQTQIFRDNIKRLTGTGLTFDLCVLPHQLPIAANLVDHCPEVTFIFDHCGVPDIKDHRKAPWAMNISEFAKRQNVIAKFLVLSPMLIQTFGRYKICGHILTTRYWRLVTGGLYEAAIAQFATLVVDWKHGLQQPMRLQILGLRLKDRCFTLKMRGGFGPKSLVGTDT